MLTDRIDQALLRAAGPQLRVVSQMAVGVDNIDLAACSRQGVVVGHTPGVLSESTADLALALMLIIRRQLFAAAARARAGQWRSWEPFSDLGEDLNGSTIGLWGFGRIGQAVAKRLRGFGTRVLYHGRTKKPAQLEHGALFVPLARLLAESDLLSIHLPLTAQTKGCVGATVLERLKPGAALINTARGEIVDQQALIAALDRGKLSGVGLDVTTPEPLPAQHALFRRDDVVILPHVGSSTTQTRRQMAELAIRNLLCGLADQPLVHSPLGDDLLD